jgi:5-methyltetrahydrofolate--homocysteine methyltransferase
MSKPKPVFSVIGERLNMHRDSFRTRVTERDAKGVLRDALRQQKAGVTHLDINTAAAGANQVRDTLWILETILPTLPDEVGLLIDSSSPECLSVALARLNGRPRTIINAITNESEKLNRILPLAIQHKTGVIALLANAAGKSGVHHDRMKVAAELHTRMREAGIPEERQYFDPQVLPLAFDPLQSGEILTVIQEIRVRWPLVHTIAGLSNISFNMPDRGLLNRTFLAMLLSAGIDSLILDPCDKHLRRVLLASRAVLGLDDYLADYLAEITHEV